MLGLSLANTDACEDAAKALSSAVAMGLSDKEIFENSVHANTRRKILPEW